MTERSCADTKVKYEREGGSCQDINENCTDPDLFLYRIYVLYTTLFNSTPLYTFVPTFVDVFGAYNNAIKLKWLDVVLLRHMFLMDLMEVSSIKTERNASCSENMNCTSLMTP